MADSTKIEWTDATWNPVTGCSVVSPGCTNCYAMRLAGTRLRNHPSRAGLTTMSKAGPVWNGKVRFNEEWLIQPLAWKKARMIFVCAHGDLFHESVPDEWIDRVFAVMALCPHHTFQVLTKRAERMRSYMGDNGCDLPDRSAGDGPRLSTWGRVMLNGMTIDRDRYIEARPKWPLPNVWLGVSAERQQEADERIPLLLQTPAAVRFVSLEPLLGPINLTATRATEQVEVNALAGIYTHVLAPTMMVDRPGDRLHWVIVGGESGPNARPMHPDWPRALRDQCSAADVPFFFKQWGEFASSDVPDAYWRSAGIFDDHATSGGWCWGNIGGRRPEIMPRIGKKRAGRKLDGIEHNAFPDPRA